MRQLLAEQPIQINAYDIDAMGIVSNIVYVRWFEDLRVTFLNEHYPLADMMKMQISPILMKTEVEYKAPLTIFDQPVGRCWMVKIGQSSWEMELEIATEKQTHCTGKQSGCFFNLEKKKVAKIPEPLKELFEMEQ
ncbi:thioesterase family protein [Solibacillus sp. FSL R5-0449]|uniref:acyl-CoA thioesterase n=1 Tax=Solibacillus sp. FSL R5-0449 TaxID=2921639 RepID=UPI0030CB68C3